MVLKETLRALFLLDSDAGNSAGNFHKVFLLIALPLGVCYVLLSPAFQVPDEHTHLFRIYHLSEGGLIADKVGNTTGAQLPRSLATTTFIYTIGIFKQNDGIINPDIIRGTFRIPLAEKDTTFTAFSNTALYSPVPYIPQTVTVFIARLFHAQPMLLLYLGRMTNLLVSVLLLTLAIRILPFFKPLFFVVLLTPTSMYQLASLSADALTISFSVLFVALVLRAVYGAEKTLHTSHIALLAMLSVAICLSKSAYFLLPLLVLVVPKQRLGSFAWGKKAAIVGAGVFALGIWAYLVKDIYSPSYAFKQIDIESARAFVLESPWRYILILTYSIVTDGWSYIQTMIGIQDWDLLVLPKWIITIYSVGILAAAIIPFRDTYRVPGWDKLLFSVIGWASLAVVLTAVYLSWSKPGMHYIVGMQGRYLIPLLPLILLPFYNVLRVPTSVARYARVSIVMLTAATLVTALVLNYFKFYVG